LFRHLLLQIGGANIAVFDCSLRSLRCSLVAAVFVGSDGTEKRCSAISSYTQLAAGAGARYARAIYFEIGGANIAVFDCSLRSLRCSLVAAVFVGSGGSQLMIMLLRSCFLR
jgi:hypothetical protein